MAMYHTKADGETTKLASAKVELLPALGLSGGEAVGTGLPWSCLGLVENKIQLKLLMSPFRLVMGTGGLCMLMSLCYAWVSRLSLSDLYFLPAPPFPGAHHLPFQEISRSLQLSCPWETTSWLGFCCHSSAGPQCGKSPVLSMQRRQELEGQRLFPRLLSNRKESCCSPEPWSTFLEIIKWL